MSAVHISSALERLALLKQSSETSHHEALNIDSRPSNKRLKPNKTDYAVLMVVFNFCVYGKAKKCYLRKDQWLEHLQKTGYRFPASYRRLKAKRKKLEDMGYFAAVREKGRNKEYTYYITNLGIKFVESLLIGNKKRPLENVKSVPSKFGKASPPHINSGCNLNGNYANYYAQKLTIENPNAVSFFWIIVNLGFNAKDIYWLIMTKPGHELISIYEKAKNAKPKNLGAYFRKSLGRYYGNL